MKLVRNPLFFTLVSFLLSGCLQQIPPLITDSTRPLEADQWQEYGACFEYVEYRLEQQYSEYGGFVATFTINQKLRILNRQGVEYGTFSMPQQSDTISSFEIRHLDKNNREVPLDLQKIRQKYEDTGVVVVPKVEPGSQIITTITFLDMDPVTNYEYWFDADLPVLHGKFSMYHANEFDYTIKSYNTRGSFLRETIGGMEGYVLEEHDILPEEDNSSSANSLLYSRYAFDKTPRVVINLDGFHVIGYNHWGYDWQQLASGYRDLYLATNHTFTTEKLAAKAQELVAGHAGEFARADAILRYVQENISRTTTRDDLQTPVNVIEVMERKNGDYLEICVVLQELYKAAGFPVNIYVTQSRNNGGFDVELPSWRQLDLPLVAVMADGKEMIAYPYRKNMRLGEMRLSVQGEYGLNISAASPTPLPAAVGQPNAFTSQATITSQAKSQKIHWQASLGGTVSQGWRNTLYDYSQEEKEKLWKNFVRSYGKDHEVEGAPELAIERGVGFTISGEVSNNSVTVARNNTLYTGLAPFFQTYFRDAKKEGITGYNNDRELLIIEKVSLPESTAGVEYHFACASISNVLFDAECDEIQSTGALELQRTIRIKKVSLSTSELKTVEGDIDQLNTISSSYYRGPADT